MTHMKLLKDYLRKNLPEIILVSVLFFLYLYYVIRSASYWKEELLITGKYADQAGLRSFMTGDLYINHKHTEEILNILATGIGSFFLVCLFIILARKKCCWVGALCTVFSVLPLIGMFINPGGVFGYTEVYMQLYQRKELIVAAVIAGLLSSLGLERYRKKKTEKSV